MKKRWRDDLPEGAPKPRHRETRGNYALRVMREADQRSMDDLARKMQEKRDARDPR